ADPASVRLARYYAKRRAVPAGNVLTLRTATGEDLPQAQFEREIASPVAASLRAKPSVDFLLLVRGVPIRVREGGYAVDSLLMSVGVPKRMLQGMELAQNPYFNATAPFSRNSFGIVLACRLDGYTEADAKALVDRSLAARPSKGPFLLDEAENRKAGGYGELQSALPRAAERLVARGLRAVLDQGTAFAASKEPLAGYASWGSNDGAFDPRVYGALRFLPGALAETFVSTSGRTFRPTSGGQSLVADLIAHGVTGVKGYVSEPFTIALARPDVLFDRYTAGRNLAESFYAASPITHWKDVVIGDPLCAPYAR
ncbi:TIGR03790 family protein, partial [bacterium]